MKGSLEIWPEIKEDRFVNDWLQHCRFKSPRYIKESWLLLLIAGTEETMFEMSSLNRPLQALNYRLPLERDGREIQDQNDQKYDQLRLKSVKGYIRIRS